MKKAICLCASIVMLSIGAFHGIAYGETGYWTTKEDPYYHSQKECGEISDRFPISENAALEFDKTPCSVCIEGEITAETLQATVRAGTYVVRIPEDYLRKFSLNGVFGTAKTDDYDPNVLANMNLMTNRENIAFQTEFIANGRVEGRYRAADLISDETALGLNIRQIDGVWYLVVRPQEHYSSEKPFRWRIMENEISVNGDGKLTIISDHEIIREDYLEIKDENALLIYQEEYGQLEISVYRSLDVNIAVIYEKNPDPYLLDGEVHIGDMDNDLKVSGYIDGFDMATYCCVLSDEELGMLVSGKEPSIYHELSLEKVQFDNGEYAPAQIGFYGVGLIDKSGKMVVDRFFKSISRCVETPEAETGPTPWFCTDEIGDISVYDPVDLREIGCYTTESEMLRAIYENPAIFILYNGTKYRVVSLENGEVLWTTPVEGLFYDQSGTRSFKTIAIDGRYRDIVSGLPKRLVVSLGEASEGVAWLADNYGKRVSGDFRSILPLVWKEDSGIFQYEALDGETGKIGLMDHFGKILTPAIYDSIETLSAESFALTAKDGKTILNIE